MEINVFHEFPDFLWDPISFVLVMPARAWLWPGHAMELEAKPWQGLVEQWSSGGVPRGPGGSQAQGPRSQGSHTCVDIMLINL